jgi:glycosyltransferase involved in cell wall biosynthesis
MKLLWVIHHPIFGGPHNKAVRLAPYLSRNDWQSSVLLPTESGNAWSRLQSSGVPTSQIQLGRVRRTVSPTKLAALAWHSAGDIKRIRSVIEHERIDLVVVTGLANPHAAIAAFKSHVPVVWQVLDTRTPLIGRRLLMSLVGRIADSVMFNGESLIEAHHVSDSLRKRSFVYYPPVDCGQFMPSTARRTAGRHRLGIPSEARVVGMVANLNPQKGVEYFIRAASLIRQRRDDVYFLLIGAEYSTHRRYTARLQSEIRAGGISDRVIFTGDLSDLENLYPVMDVKLITSVPRSEGTTTTALEAMACGVPVVATRVGAVAEVVGDGVTGLLVPPLDTEALADAALRLLDDDQLRQLLGSNGRRRAVTRFDIERCGAAHLQAFQTAVARKAAGRWNDKQAELAIQQTELQASPTQAREVVTSPQTNG